MPRPLRLHPLAIRMIALVVLAIPTLGLRASDATLRDAVTRQVTADFPSLEAIYRDIHAHPELSFMETRTAALLAGELRALGFEVTERVGRTGIVAVLKNGAGRTVLLRADMDALPIKEETGLPFASKVVVQDHIGKSQPAMHACAHDVHVTGLIGAARVLAALKHRWTGTLVLIGQPAEEIGGGAIAMLEDGLFTRFPLPDYVLALHARATLPAGEIATTPGLAYGNVDSIDILVRGIGGHGARPHSTKDPVVLASEIVLALQTIVSREVEPGTMAVVTVGAIHGGTKRNIIPEEVRLELTLRSFDDRVAEHLLRSIKRISENLARATGLPENRLPVITTAETRFPTTYNDPALTHRLTGTFRDWFGATRVSEGQPSSGGEDFAHYGRTAQKIPISMWAVGCGAPVRLAEVARSGQPPPSNHSPHFYPVLEPTLKAAVTSLSAASLELLAK